MATSPEREDETSKAQTQVDLATTTQNGNHSYLLDQDLLIGGELID
jgi:hypothetical protein